MMNRRNFLTLALVAATFTLAPRAASAQEVGRATIDELKSLMARGAVVVLDVRGLPDTKIKGALHIPLDQVEARAGELPRDREIITYCA